MTYPAHVPLCSGHKGPLQREDLAALAFAPMLQRRLCQNCDVLQATETPLLSPKPKRPQSITLITIGEPLFSLQVPRVEDRQK